MTRLNIFKYTALFGLALAVNCYADNTDLQVKAAITAKLNSSGGASRIMCTNKLRCNLALTGQLYSAESSAILWSHNGKPVANANQLMGVLRNSYQSGLNPDDYHLTQLDALSLQINQRLPNPDAQALADFDLTLTDAFLLFAKHMATGRVDNLAVYPKWTISKRQVDLVDLLHKATSQSDGVLHTITAITPSYYEYQLLQEQLALYQKIALEGGWNTIPTGPVLKVGAKGGRVAELQKRLLITGEYNDEDKHSVYGKNLKAAVSRFQSNHGIKANGIVDKNTLQALNVPVNQVIKIIELNMDRLRWLPLQMSDHYLLVNIPNFSLDVIESNQSVLNMPVIVGKGANRSCVLSSKISYIEINPYWSIPNSIARKETLPKLQQDPGYANKEQINVYYGSYGSTPINPLSVNWKKVDPENMPYKFRQMPGDKNALGHIKFIFPNVCGIYLHDTPTRNLFGKNRRDFSHGCIRVGKPLELADYLLSDKPNWDGDRVESQIKLGKRQIVYLPESVDVNIIYATAWVESGNQLQFRSDIYQIDNIDFPVYLPSDVNKKEMNPESDE